MTKRLQALDVFRGITIFFMIIVNTPGSWTHVYSPLRHAKWNGCTPTDLVFPFFLFIVGVSMAFSYQKSKSNGNWVSKALKRTALIFLIGLLLNWFPFYDKSILDLRVFGVLQRIALAFGGGALIIHFFKKRHLPYLLGLILLSYYGILMLLGGSDPLSLEGNLVRTIDLSLFGESHIYGGYGIPFDPEGLLSTLPSIGTVILAYLIGSELIDFKMAEGKLKRLSIYGIVFIILGLIWHWLGFPINKPIWSSSYVLFTGGLGTLFLVFLIWVIDLKQWTNWTYVFKVFGMNPLVSYAMSGLLVKTFFKFVWNDSNLYGHLYTDFFQSYFGNEFGSLLQAVWFTFVIWMIANWLYKKGKFIKV